MKVLAKVRLDLELDIPGPVVDPDDEAAYDRVYEATKDICYEAWPALSTVVVGNHDVYIDDVALEDVDVHL
ncbi:MAG: hypothetical protein KY395_00250 [Actinobacteria bacterium]|nr:hypothetical protein [Actinomycetota bacterium]